MTKPNLTSQAIPQARKIVLIAGFIAATIVLQRLLAFRTPIIQVNFMLVPIFLSAIMLGWRSSTFVAVISDLIGALLFPSGAFFIGYTLTAALTGFVAGACLYRPDGVRLDRAFLLRLALSILIIMGLLNGVLNTIWIFMLSGAAGNVIVPLRIVKQLLMAPIIYLVMLALLKTFAPRIQQLAFAEIEIPVDDIHD